MFFKHALMDQVNDNPTSGGSVNATPTTNTASAPVGDPPAISTQQVSTQTQKITWPEDWRQQIAGTDEKELKLLGRYASPAEVWKKARSLEQRMSSGELKASLPKDATPEEIKSWRDQNGIPESADKYDLDLGNNVKVSDEDKSLFGDYLKIAHETNQTPEQVKATLNSYYKIQDQLNEKRNEDDRKIAQKTEDALRAEWGSEYRRNINLVNSLLDSVGGSGEFKDKVLRGRLSDGTPIGSSPEALKMFVQLSLINNPVGTVVPGGSGDMMKSVADEIKQIEDFMAKNRNAYFKDEAKQSRYRDLLAARDQLNKKAA